LWRIRINLHCLKIYLWGNFVWNMFDFGSAHRNEGDVLGVNTKGLVTFNRQTRNDRRAV
jgi:beta-galactosidase